MSYKILETHVVYENDKLKEVAVLWADKDWVRGTFATNKPTSGYEFLMPNATVSSELFQRVAGAGMYLDDNRKKKYFPGKRNWSR